MNNIADIDLILCSLIIDLDSWKIFTEVFYFWYTIKMYTKNLKYALTIKNVFSIKPKYAIKALSIRSQNVKCVVYLLGIRSS